MYSYELVLTPSAVYKGACANHLSEVQPDRATSYTDRACLQRLPDGVVWCVTVMTVRSVLKTRTKEFNWSASRCIWQMLRRSESKGWEVCPSKVYSGKKAFCITGPIRIISLTGEMTFRFTVKGVLEPRALGLRPERWWTMLGHGEVKWKLDRSLQQRGKKILLSLNLICNCHLVGMV